MKNGKYTTTTAERQKIGQKVNVPSVIKKKQERIKNSYFCWPHIFVAVALELALFLGYFELVFLVQNSFANPWGGVIT